jgi:hypothetical protein
MPDGVFKLATQVGNAIPFVAATTLLCCVCSIAWYFGIDAFWLYFHPHAWQGDALKGCVAGFAWVAVYGVSLILSSPSKEVLANHYLLTRPPGFWVLLSTFASPIEETWRILCMLALGTLGTTPALVVMTLAWSIAHAKGNWRSVSVAALFAMYAGILFVETQSLVVLATTHLTLNFGTILLVNLIYRKVRYSTRIF